MDTGNEKTVGIKQCADCGGGLLQTDRFCRWCSACQIESTSNVELYRPVSGPLVKVMARSVSTGALSQPRSPVMQTLLAALLSFPVWLMIVFLSPFDAYFAARTMARRS